MKILVTGAAGFIGTNFCQLYRKQAELVTLDRLDPQSNKVEVDHPYDLFFLRHFTTPEFALMDQDAGDITHILHLAAQTHVDRSITSSYPFIQSNVDGTQALLELAIKLPKLEKFIYVSTDEVYGSTPKIKFIESDRLKPTSPYAASKAAGELIAQSYQRTHGLPLIITRSTNNYGLYQHEEKFIPLICKSIASGKPIPIYGTGANVRDWLHVTDHCAALWQLLNSGTVGEIYNIGADNPLSNNELVEKIRTIAGQPNAPTHYVQDRKAHDFRYAVDCYKIWKEFGWGPKVDFTTGLSQATHYYLAKFRK